MINSILTAYTPGISLSSGLATFFLFLVLPLITNILDVRWDCVQAKEGKATCVWTGDFIALVVVHIIPCFCMVLDLVVVQHRQAYRNAVMEGGILGIYGGAYVIWSIIGFEIKRDWSHYTQEYLSSHPMLSALMHTSLVLLCIGFYFLFRRLNELYWTSNDYTSEAYGIRGSWTLDGPAVAEYEITVHPPRSATGTKTGYRPPVGVVPQDASIQ